MTRPGYRAATVGSRTGSGRDAHRRQAGQFLGRLCRAGGTGLFQTAAGLCQVGHAGQAAGEIAAPASVSA